MKTLKAHLTSLTAYVVSVSLVLTGMLPISATAQSVPCEAAAADTGSSPNCASARIGGATVAYPKFNWERLSELPITPSLGSTQILGGSAVESLANRSAKVLGLSASDIANVVTAFPTNVPYIVARYNPMDASLSIDLFKLEKTLDGHQVKAALYHTQFSPAHGNMWKASRSYISPVQFKSGTTPGINPFAAFQRAGSDSFYNISLAAAQVAVGHAMRAIGAPLALMSVAQPRLSSKEQTDSGWFTKTTKVWVYGHAKSLWYIAQPVSTLSRSTTLGFASFCTTDPAQTNCQKYETAVSGVSFEQFDGGSLSAFEDQWQIDYKEQSGFTFLAMLVVVVVGSFLTAGLLAGAGLELAAGGAAAGSGSVAMGTLGTSLTQLGILSADFVTTIGASIGIEVAGAGAVAVLGGANLGSTFDLGPEALLGVAPVSKGMEAPVLGSDYQNRVNEKIAAKTTGDLVTGGALSGVNATVTGGCALSALAKDCGAVGVIARPDELREQNGIEFMRDNSGQILRTAAVPSL